MSETILNGLASFSWRKIAWSAPPCVARTRIIGLKDILGSTLRIQDGPVQGVATLDLVGSCRRCRVIIGTVPFEYWSNLDMKLWLQKLWIYAVIMQCLFLQRLLLKATSIEYNKEEYNTTRPTVGDHFGAQVMFLLVLCSFSLKLRYTGWNPAPTEM